MEGLKAVWLVKSVWLVKACGADCPASHTDQTEESVGEPVSCQG